MRIRTQFRVQGFYGQKLEKFTAEIKKIALYLYLGLHKGRGKLQEKPSAFREHPALQNMKFLFLIFVGHFALLDPDPDPATQTNADPDPKP
jgi:hypothetical protein